MRLPRPLCLTLAGALPALGQDLPDLRTLLRTPVTVASKTPESVLVAPGSATVYLDRDLGSLGLWNLADLADFTAGFSSYPIYGERVFETRGQKAGSFNNNKHLLLVDGIPFSHARNGKVPTEGEFPLLGAERVEFLRGPASSLYGTGAFFGVVKVTSRVDGDGDLREGLATFGDTQDSRRLMATLAQQSEGATSHLSVGYLCQEDSLRQVGPRPDPANRLRDRQESLFLQVAHSLKEGPLAGLSAGFLLSRKQGGLGEFWTGTYTRPENDLTWSTAVPYLKLERALGADVGFEARTYANTSVEEGRYVGDPLTGAPSHYRSRVRSLGGALEVRWALAPRQVLILGLEGEGRREAYDAQVPGPGGTYLDAGAPETGAFRTWSAFGQWQAHLPWETVVTLGLRADRGTNPLHTYAQTSPRLALVKHLGPRDSLKLLMGTALRGPGLKEVNLNQESLATHPGLQLPGLKAETFRTTEVAWVHTGSQGIVSMSLFQNVTRDALDGTQVGGVNVFLNAPGETRARGGEVEARLLGWDGSWQLWGQVSAARAEGPTGTPLLDVPTWKASVAISAPLGPLQGTFRARHVDGWRRGSADPLPGLTLLDLLLALRTGHGRPSLQVEVRNLLDRDVRIPKAGQPDVPLPRRGVWLSLGWHGGSGSGTVPAQEAHGR